MNKIGKISQIIKLTAISFLLFSFIMCSTAPSETSTPGGARAEPGILGSATPSTGNTRNAGTLRDSIVMYAGTADGLFSVSAMGRVMPLWSGGSVKKLIPPQANDNTWTIYGSEGVLVSNDLEKWEPRNNGLPMKTIKIFEGGEKSFIQILMDLKDFEINPVNPQIMVTATKDLVYLTRNQGLSWTALPRIGYIANGIKAAASAHFNGELTVFVSHSIHGVFYIQPDTPNAKWNEIYDGLEKQETTNYPDEVSDIIVIPNESSGNPEIYASQTFRRRLYKLNWDGKTFNMIFRDDSVFGTIDSLSAGKNELYFIQEGTVSALNYQDSSIQKQTDITDSLVNVRSQLKPNTVFIRDKGFSLHELWLLDETEPGQPIPPAARITENKEGLFMPVHHASDMAVRRNYYDLFERTGINMIVIDMKDEFGRLRFVPNNPEIRRLGTVVYPLDLEEFLADMKARGIFVVARVVVFKDQELYKKENGRFAVWDGRNQTPWTGTGFSEFWVDPYSEEVWEYVAMISEELYERGIDEIQYDYVRFPTDGANLADARYRWHDEGMDMESAIYSFLRHMRSRVKAPISIDLYGANCWYRTGTRTGQEVEILASLVDVICPMYYPSHFEQFFLAHPPAELRPWRIYYHGTLRASRIARGSIVIRPWAQAFRLNVSYDRQYYGTDYVRRQIEGVREAGNGGFTYWNMGGRYEDIPDK